MPVEIKELVIRAIAEPGGESDETTRTVEELDGGRTAIVEACVREVLRIMKRSKER